MFVYIYVNGYILTGCVVYSCKLTIGYMIMIIHYIYKVFIIVLNFLCFKKGTKLEQLCVVHYLDIKCLTAFHAVLVFVLNNSIFNTYHH